MFQNNERIIVKGEDQTDKISDFNESEGKVNITYKNGKTYTYKKENVQIDYSALSEKTTEKHFQYLKQIAETVSLEDPDGGNILSKHYNKINFIDKKCMLSAFLSGKLNSTELKNTHAVIYPFGFNLSQKTAVDKALNNPLSIIEGPPGTGKTQTILNIIANAVMRNENVAIVSSNNSATANVLEKLLKYNVDFIAAYLGSYDNKNKFIESQKELPQDIKTWKLSDATRISILKSISNLFTALNTMHEKRNKLSNIRQELDSIEVEHRHFIEYFSYDNETIAHYLKPINTSADALKLWFICEKYVKNGKIPLLITRIINRFKYGIFNKKFYSIGSDMISICQNFWYMTRISELTLNTSILQNELEQFNFKKKMDEYTSLSMQLFRDYLSEKYKDNKRRIYTLDDLRVNSRTFINDYPVILSTTYSICSSLSSTIMYDYIIIDEASQVNIATGALALSCAKKAVVVGDLKQLPNVVKTIEAKSTDKIFNEFKPPEAYRYKNHSLLLSLIELFPNAPRTLLREHYRCHPKIIGFCNQKFYNDQLIILTEAKSERIPLLVYKTVEGNHARNHVNQRQIDVIKNEIIPKQNLDNSDISIGIVTPYRNQTNVLQNTFKETGILADTVDKFQGRENDVIILSTVDNEITEFTDNANRLNVAVSRAIKQLIVVVNNGDDMKDKNIGDLIRYIDYNNFKIINSEIRSIFDFLYAGYYKRRMELLKKQKKISEHDSENLMYKLISDVLSKEQFTRFDVSVHVPLKMIIRNMSKLNAEEKQFTENILTHVDFLIFDKIGKLPRLVVEVDGAAFHKKGSRQAERDEMKDTILEKYNLPIRRFKTTESNEEERLTAALEEIIGI
jgi:superfamily I DNA and/or RNA helicase